MVKAFWTDRDPDIALYCGDNRIVIPQLEAESVDSVVTDPPYELGFMGKGWDRSGIAYDIGVWRECLRVLKPGGHLLAFGGSRTYHRLACAVEDAGFEIRDQIQWLYGSGFPKSLDVSKAIDAALGAEREIIGHKAPAGGYSSFPHDDDEWVHSKERALQLTAPTTEAARQWNGWGTALKPAHEPIVLARKPLIGTVAENVLQHGTGGLNINGCRIGTEVETWPSSRAKPAQGYSNALYTHRLAGQPVTETVSTGDAPNGRWPANVIHDGSEEVVSLFPETASGSGIKNPIGGTSMWERGSNWRDSGAYEGDSGSAARFFYCAKATQGDRNEGLEKATFREKYADFGLTSRVENGQSTNGRTNTQASRARNYHPTVKPTDLMRYLCRLITPPGGLVLDPFCGSGSTGKAARAEGFCFIGIEINEEYCTLAAARCEIQQRSLFGE